MKITNEAIESAAKEAFWSDDMDGHVAGGWTWDTIPEVGRENYRRMARAAITKALPHLQRTITSRDEVGQLPENTVIRDADGLVWHAEGPGWVPIGNKFPGYDLPLPAVVLWEPEP